MCDRKPRGVRLVRARGEWNPWTDAWYGFGNVGGFSGVGISSTSDVRAVIVSTPHGDVPLVDGAPIALDANTLRVRALDPTTGVLELELYETTADLMLARRVPHPLAVVRGPDVVPVGAELYVAKPRGVQVTTAIVWATQYAAGLTDVSYDAFVVGRTSVGQRTPTPLGAGGMLSWAFAGTETAQVDVSGADGVQLKHASALARTLAWGVRFG